MSELSKVPAICPHKRDERRLVLENPSYHKIDRVLHKLVMLLFKMNLNENLNTNKNFSAGHTGPGNSNCRSDGARLGEFCTPIIHY
uniref:Uncharacterized protein n=1 Tax=Glossina brevipalpis TaxID=37001 RepID=A0A1A9W7U7_9MUSC